MKPTAKRNNEKSDIISLCPCMYKVFELYINFIFIIQKIDTADLQPANC